MCIYMYIYVYIYIFLCYATAADPSPVIRDLLVSQSDGRHGKVSQSGLWFMYRFVVLVWRSRCPQKGLGNSVNILIFQMRKHRIMLVRREAKRVSKRIKNL